MRLQKGRGLRPPQLRRAEGARDKCGVMHSALALRCGEVLGGCTTAGVSHKGWECEVQDKDGKVGLENVSKINKGSWEPGGNSVRTLKI